MYSVKIMYTNVYIAEKLYLLSDCLNAVETWTRQKTGEIPSVFFKSQGHIIKANTSQDEIIFQVEEIKNG